VVSKSVRSDESETSITVGPPAISASRSDTQASLGSESQLIARFANISVADGN
jgi:hypothetical protein